MNFQGDSGVTPDPGTSPGLRYLACPRALVTIIPGSLKPDSRDPETETGSLETEKRVHRIHGTLEKGLHKDASQPGGPHRGGGAPDFRLINVTLMSCAQTAAVRDPMVLGLLFCSCSEFVRLLIQVYLQI